MDGFDTTEGVILVATTNRPDVLDPALLSQPIRQQVVVNQPTGPCGDLKIHTKKVPIAAGVGWEDRSNLPVSQAPIWKTWSMRLRSGLLVRAKPKSGRGFRHGEGQDLDGTNGMVLTDEESGSPPIWQVMP